MRFKKRHWFFKGPQPTEAVEDYCSTASENLRLTAKALGIVAKHLPESAQLEVAKALGFEEAP